MNIMVLPAELRVQVRRSPRLIVAVSELPEPAGKLILHVVKKSRLWRREKAEVAEELVFHFDDGLAAGRTVEDLLATFGDPAVAAKLIRRGKKRNRPAWWQALRYAVKGFAWFLLLYATSSLLLALREPNIGVDYIAAVNGRLPTAPIDQQAWPIYRAAFRAHPLGELREALHAGATDADGNVVEYTTLELRPRDPDWSRALAVLDKYRAVVDAARAAGLKPVYGLPVLPLREYSTEDLQAMGFPLPAAGTSRSYSPAQRSLYTVPWQGRLPMWWICDLLALDSSRAAADGDAARVVQNYTAMIGMARQAREVPVQVALHASSRIAEVADRTLAEVDHTYPKLLDGRRVALLHAMAGASDVFDFDASGQRLLLLDMIQRTYSDNGRGNGTLTYDGIYSVVSQAYLGDQGYLHDPPLEEKGLYLASLPAAATVGASRREITEMVERYFDVAKREAEQPLWQRLRGESETVRLADEWRASPSSLYGFRNFLLMVFLPRFEPTMHACGEARALHEATMTALALSVWRERYGGYPASLAELVPQYLPKLPVDHSSGRPLRYKRVDGHPLLYGLGRDQVDHDGARGDKPAHRPYLPPPAADWVLYPPIRAELDPPDVKN